MSGFQCERGPSAHPHGACSGSLRLRHDRLPLTEHHPDGETGPGACSAPESLVRLGSTPEAPSRDYDVAHRSDYGRATTRGDPLIAIRQ